MTSILDSLLAAPNARHGFIVPRSYGCAAYIETVDDEPADSRGPTGSPVRRIGGFSDVYDSESDSIWSADDQARDALVLAGAEIIHDS